MIDGKHIESCLENVDIATTILGLARYSDDYSRSAGPSMMFSKDTNDHPENRNVTMNAAGTAVESMNENFNLGFAARRSMLDGDEMFSCSIPLSHIFGFCRDVRKVIFGAKHTIVLVRKESDNDAIGRDNAVAAGKVIITKLSLWMPVIVPSITEENKLLSFMNQGGKSLLSWKTMTTDSIQGNAAGLFTWHISAQHGVSAPRDIFIAFQGNTRVNNQRRNPMVFDTLAVTEVSLRINGHQEPAEEVTLNFGQNKVARAYHRLMSFMGRDLNVDTGLQISQRDFTTLYPIYYFSLEHLDLFRQSVVDIYFRAQVGFLPAGGFRAIAVILSDRAVLLEGVGGRMRVVDAPIENM
jgi:hypothetical protein